MWECFCECVAADVRIEAEKEEKRKFAPIMMRVCAALCPSVRQQHHSFPMRRRKRDPFKVATSSITHAAAAVISPPHSFQF